MYCYKKFILILKESDSQITLEAAFHTDAQRDVYGSPRYSHVNDIIKSCYKKLIYKQENIHN